MGRLFPFCLLSLSACILLPTEADDRSARVDVDPVVRQSLMTLATGERTENEPRQDPDEVACAVAIPRTCAVSDYVQITVFNGGAKPIVYQGNFCPTPMQRLGVNGWEWIARQMNCVAIGLVVRVGAGETDTRSVYLPGSIWGYDWQAASDELRVVLDIWDRDGDLPLELRTSDPFRLIWQSGFELD